MQFSYFWRFNAFLSPDERWQKRSKKWLIFYLTSESWKNAKNCSKTARFCCMLSCQNTVNTSVFGWFALRPGSKKMKNTVVFAVHFKPLVEKTSQNTAFSTHSLQNSVNSSVFGRFSSLTLQKRRKYQCFFFYRHKNSAKYIVFLMFLVQNIWSGATTTSSSSS